jgi:predicted ribosome quality control (RQC) complex YloA/Tae2 family protein
MKVRLTKQIDTADGPLKPGELIERPDAFWLLRLEVAEPVDDEAKAEFAQLEAARKGRQDRIRVMAEEQAKQQRAIEEATAKLTEQERKAEEEQRHAEFEAVLRGEINESA